MSVQHKPRISQSADATCSLLPALLVLAALLAAPGEAHAQAGGAAPVPTFSSLLLLDAGTAPTPLAQLEVLVTPDSVVVPEGGTAVFKVALSRPPIGQTTLAVSRVSGDGDITPLTTSLTFGPDDWYVLKEVSVAAAADADGAPGVAGIVVAADSLRASVTAVEKDSTPPAPSHAGRFAGYEGAATCKGCHAKATTEMFSTIHYQWKGSTSMLANPSEPLQGKLGGINDFCTTPDISWLSKLTTVYGTQTDGGCAKCHAGLGLKPDAVETVDQVNNIDCLMCHGRSYSRSLASVNGVWVQMPSPASTFQDVVRPGKIECLRCHTKSGGGNNFKRGDIEEFHKSPTAAFDVHMAAVADGGKGLTCVNCHVFKAADGSYDHKISGRGNDLRAVEGQPLSCARSGCHQAAPHKSTTTNSAALNRHTAKVNCTSCHIPHFARMAPTDMRRDFGSRGELLFTSGLYEPAMERAGDVQPEYAFWNATSRVYNLHDQTADYATSDVIQTAAPVGSLNDPAAKLFAFKRHDAVQPMTTTGELIPLKMGILFQTGDNLTAITTGAEAVGMDPSGYTLVQTERWTGLFHEVAPRAQALACASCHTSLGGTRVPFTALGYTPTRPVSPTCSSGCHGDESGEWIQKGFVKGHDIHVREEGKPCSTCHAITGR